MLPLRLFCSLAASLCRTKPGTHRPHNAKNGAAPKGAAPFSSLTASCLYACLRLFAAFPYEAACGGLKRRPPSERRSRAPFGKRSCRSAPAASPAERAQNPVCIQNRPRRRFSRKNGSPSGRSAPPDGQPPDGSARASPLLRSAGRRRRARLPAATICAAPSP